MNQAKTFFLMVVLTIIFVALGSLIGGQDGAMIAFFIALVMNFVSYWFCDKNCSQNVRCTTDFRG